MSVIRGLWERFRHLIAELMKFGTVGGLAFFVDLGVSNLLWTLGWETISAKAIAVAVAATAAFVGNRFWTFRHRARQGLRREYTLYFLINGIGLLIALVPLTISTHVLHLDGQLAKNISGNGIGLVLGTLFRFWAYKKWVFLAPEPPPADPHTDPPEPRPAPPTGELDDPDLGTTLPTVNGHTNGQPNGHAHEHPATTGERAPN